MHAPHFHVHKLTHAEAARIGGFLVLAAIVAEAGIAWHLFRAHDVLTGSLVLTAWLKEHIAKLIAYISTEIVA